MIFSGDFSLKSTDDADPSSAPAAPAKKPATKKRKSSVSKPRKALATGEQFGDIPTLSACESPMQSKEKDKSGQLGSSAKIPSSKIAKIESVSTSAVATSPVAAKMSKKKGSKTPSAEICHKGSEEVSNAINHHTATTKEEGSENTKRFGEGWPKQKQDGGRRG